MNVAGAAKGAFIIWASKQRGESVQLDDEDTASAVGVVVVEVPADIATAALTVGSLPTDTLAALRDALRSLNATA